MRCFRGMLRFRRLLLLRCAFFFFLLLLLYSLPVNPKDVGLIFRDCARKIHTKAVTADPNILRISVACGKVRFSSFLPSSLPTFPPCLPSFPPLSSFLFLFFLSFPSYQPTPPSQIEQWLERNYPSVIHLSSQQGDAKVTLDPRNPRTRIISLEKAFDAQLAKKKRVEDLRNGL